MSEPVTISVYMVEWQPPIRLPNGEETEGRWMLVVRTVQAKRVQFRYGGRFDVVPVGGPR